MQLGVKTCYSVPLYTQNWHPFEGYAVEQLFFTSQEIEGARRRVLSVFMFIQRTFEEEKN